ncbi:hypothetical protein [Streptomyces sp900116325]|uniref:hypothetical protein n=1 Tax=Streptomyces sp. 900116325 TaxID=3154295 RepID=UPI00331F09AE
MNNHITSDGVTTRRNLLRAGALASGAAAAASLVPAGAASAATGNRGAARSPGQVPGTCSAVDISHATPAVAERLVRYFRRKSAQDLDGTMALFARRPCMYIDATLGWDLGSWAEIHAFFAQYMPGWPAGSASYPVRILGDMRSAVVFFTDTAGLFGPSELRLAGAVDLENGLIARQVDYWDGRHFGVEDLAGLQVPADRFPTDFGESTVRGSRSAVMQHVVRDLAGALRKGDGAAAARLFAPDAVFEDAPAHIRIEGPRSIGGYLTAASGLLPYVGKGTGVRHVLGNELGGGYEYTSADGPVPRGLVGLELDRWRKISRFTAMWDGALVDDAVLLSLAGKAVER